MTAAFFLLDQLPRRRRSWCSTATRAITRPRSSGPDPARSCSSGTGAARCSAARCASVEPGPPRTRRSSGVGRSPAPDPRLVVVQALAKGDRAELAVELLTELGADEIVPWSAAHSVTRWDAERAVKGLARWQAHRARGRQAEPPGLAAVRASARLDRDGDRAPSSGRRCRGAARERHRQPGGGAAAGRRARSSLVVGPEGGHQRRGARAVRRGRGGDRPDSGSRCCARPLPGGAALAALSPRLGAMAVGCRT